MDTTNAMVMFGITGLEGQTDLKFKVRAPAGFTPSDLQRIAKDCDILKEKLASHPQEMSDLMALVLKGKLRDAREIARELNITEEAIVAQEGGFFFLILAAVAIGGVLIAEDTGDDDEVNN